MATDPVCGMSVDEQTAAATSTYGGKTYYFCAQECKTKFDANPQRYTEVADGHRALEKRGRDAFYVERKKRTDLLPVTRLSCQKCSLNATCIVRGSPASDEIVPTLLPVMSAFGLPKLERSKTLKISHRSDRAWRSESMKRRSMVKSNVM